MDESISIQESVYFETWNSNRTIAASASGPGDRLGMVAATGASIAIWSQAWYSLFFLHGEYFELPQGSL